MKKITVTISLLILLISCADAANVKQEEQKTTQKLSTDSQPSISSTKQDLVMQRLIIRSRVDGAKAVKVGIDAMIIDAEVQIKQLDDEINKIDKEQKK